MTLTVFETTTCGRCGGSGHFSFNLMHGTMCYGCSGSGVKYTKRGLAAKDYFSTLLTVPVEELKPGIAILLYNHDKTFRVITHIDCDEDRNLGKKYICAYTDSSEKLYYIQVEGGGSKIVSPGSQVRVYHDVEQKKAKFQEALRYQSTLGTNGKAKSTKTKRI